MSRSHSSGPRDHLVARPILAAPMALAALLFLLAMTPATIAQGDDCVVTISLEAPQGTTFRVFTLSAPMEALDSSGFDQFNTEQLRGVDEAPLGGPPYTVSFPAGSGGRLTGTVDNFNDAADDLGGQDLDIPFGCGGDDSPADTQGGSGDGTGSDSGSGSSDSGQTGDDTGGSSGGDSGEGDDDGNAGSGDSSDAEGTDDGAQGGSDASDGGTSSSGDGGSGSDSGRLRFGPGAAIIVGGVVLVAAIAVALFIVARHG